MILARSFLGGGQTLAAGWEFDVIGTTPVNTSLLLNWNADSVVEDSLTLNWSRLAPATTIEVDSFMNIKWIHQTATIPVARNLMKILAN